MDEDIFAGQLFPDKINDKKIGPRFIYIVHITNTNYYKIGIADIVEIRLKNLQTANPFELKLIYSRSFIDHFQIENYIHNFYIKKNVRGEWFELLIEDVYEIIHFLKRLEHTKDIKGEIKKRLRLQKKHLEILKFNDKSNGTVIRKSFKVSFIAPKIMKNRTTGALSVYFRIKNPETKAFKTFIITGNINREKNLEVRAIKAERLKDMLTRLLENGLSPIENREDFRNLIV